MCFNRRAKWATTISIQQEETAVCLKRSSGKVDSALQQAHLIRASHKQNLFTDAYISANVSRMMNGNNCQLEYGRWLGLCENWTVVSFGFYF